ncbi:carbohydrate porin [Rhizobium sp. ICMP 5592]|uniref:carbohydrate porin n=1 Tax=Rhizobium sp. ICMP 5592 TaxID=2292445 RepID=UPI001295E67B|nr:carbohydrate porin [Rhizobium sp. ICMP 5592]MQB45945.1 carbohydrate-selective porin, OprB family superfamily [Rhizobium sp. ICMP 5592]
MEIQSSRVRLRKWKLSSLGAAIVVAPLAFAGQSWAQSPGPDKAPWLKSLSEIGIDVRGLYVVGGAATVTGGAEEGKLGIGSLMITHLDFDLGRIAGWSGTKIKTEFTMYPINYPKDGEYFSQYAGSFLGGDQYPTHDADFQPWLSQLTLEHDFGNGFKFEFGKTTMQRYFFPNVCGMDILCSDPVIKYDSQLPPPDAGTLGFVASVDASDNLTLRFGAQQLRDIDELFADHGWNAFSTKGHAGIFYIGGVRYRTEVDPVDVELAGWYADTTLVDSYTGEARTGTSGLQLKWSKTIWSAEDSGPSEGLAVFGAFADSFDDTRPIDWSATLGLRWENPYKSPSGEWGISQISAKAIYARVGESTLLAQREQRVASGGQRVLGDPNQWRLSLDMITAFGKHVFIQSSLEYVINPDSSQSRQSELPKDGIIASTMINYVF